MARLHAAAFEGAARWSVDGFQDILHDPLVFVAATTCGFVVGRAVADEAELLTIVVDGPGRGRGVGRGLVDDFAAEARRRGASQAFLEVAEDNSAARALYDSTGWHVAGRRPGYYGGIDALILRRAL
ncbi:ribosomal-protein-alanine N-acetyltransferase [Jannaschia donghaensis]|uniref:Ribosomal-protein-alanine N-acetyltransferase n=2 Tax=Jannaschia donghaensis TaxID=420998 RepID=A0A0M6YF40_9RHOB|nr:ribosomal-protein-alanine N-acetyltransferase [Jannaschia donghaensis]